MPERRHLSPEDWELWRALSAMTSQLGLALDRRLRRDAGVSQADFQVISTLAQAPSGQLRPGELVELLGWEKSRVSHQLARMEARGLVERASCDEDARGTWVSLSGEGRGLAEGVARAHAAAIREYFLDVLDDEERAALLTVAERVLDGLNPVACDIAEAHGMAPARSATR